MGSKTSFLARYGRLNRISQYTGVILTLYWLALLICNLHFLSFKIFCCFNLNSNFNYLNENKKIVCLFFLV